MPVRNKTEETTIIINRTQPIAIANMVCQSAPAPPVEKLYRNPPNNLPARWVPHRVFVVRHHNADICIPINKKTKPQLRLILPAPRIDDKGWPVYHHVNIVGWRWALADAADPKTDICALGLNVPGVLGYDKERNRWGEYKHEEDKSPQDWKETVWWRLKALGQNVENQLDKVCIRLNEMIEDRGDKKNKPPGIEAGEYRVNIDFAKLMAIHPDFWN